MRNHNKRWLISRMKSSGSLRSHLMNGSYSEYRNTKKYTDIENLPSKESIGKTCEFYNGKINTNLVARFLRGNVGKPWDKVYAEIVARIPKKLMHYDNVILWYVADKVEFVNSDLFDLREQKFLIKDNKINWRTTTLEFYVDPRDKNLKYISELVIN